MQNTQNRWKIAKTMDCCYGHRVWTQELNTAFSLDGKCACRHLHGHQGTITVHLDGDTLNPQGMVTDFKHLNWMKKLIDDVMDHKFIIDYHDPLFQTLLPHYKDFSVKEDFALQLYHNHRICWKPNLQKINGAEKHLHEMYEGYTIVDFVPTSENLSKWLFEIASDVMKPLNVTVSCVQFFETPKSQANYYQV